MAKDFLASHSISRIDFQVVLFQQQKKMYVAIFSTVVHERFFLEKFGWSITDQPTNLAAAKTHSRK